MSTPATRPVRPSLRRILNRAWLTLLAVLAAEGVWFIYSAQSEASRHNANINRIKREAWATSKATGTMWYELDDARVIFAVFDDFPQQSEESLNYSGHTVALSYPFSEGKVWLNLSLTQRVRVNQSPPQIFFVRNGHVRMMDLPSGFDLNALNRFRSSRESSDGAAGFQRWLTMK